MLMAKLRGKFRKFDNPRVAAIFDGYPENVRPKLLFLRELIFDTASEIKGVGKLEETLRWGEPSYLTAESGSGSMVRINAKGSQGRYAIYFHCQTNLVETFRDRHGDAVPVEELRHCVSLALTYHRERSGRNKSRSRGGK
jgi:hypothetical protein